MFVDPFGDYSAIHLGTWQTPALPFRAGDRLVGLAGQPVPPGSAKSFDEVVASVVPGEHLDLSFERAGATVTARLPVRLIGPNELWWLFGFYALLGCSFLWSGFAVWRVAPGRLASRVYFVMSVNAFCFLTTFFDYHTTRALTPVFAAASLGNALCLLGLALTFPTPPRRLLPFSRTIRALTALGVGAMLMLVVGAAFSFDFRALRLAVNVLVPGSLLVLAASSVTRYFLQPREGRADLHWTVGSLAAVPLWLAATALIDQQLDVDLLHLSLPLAGLAVPAGIGLSLIKRDFLTTGAILTRQLLFPPVVFTAAAIAGAAWVWCHSEGASFAAASALALAVFVIGTVGGWAALTRLFLRGRALYQPLITALADRLAVVHDEPAVRRALEEVTGTLFPDCTVRFVELEPRDPSAGVWWVDGPPRELRVPLTTAGGALGALAISARPTGALFTVDELAILETLSSFGAVALHNANTLRQLNELRELEVSASKEDKRLSVDLLAAEVAHEIAYPLNYFRHFLRGLARGGPPIAEDVELGQEEVSRLERMLASVRRLQNPSPVLRVVDLGQVVDRAIALLAVDLRAREQQVARVLEVDRLTADADQLLQVFSNLLRNGSEAAGRGGRLGISAVARADHTEVCVWDDGPGIAEDARAKVFSPWFTTRPEGTGLGLAVTQRIIQSFGWTIEIERRGSLTTFVLRAPLTPHHT